MSPEEEKAWRAELDQMGVTTVREYVGRPAMWGDARDKIAYKWLGEKERAAEDSMRAQSDMARSAKNAAWAAAIAAIISAIAAIIAIFAQK